MNRTTGGAVLPQSAGGRQCLSTGTKPMGWTSTHCSGGLRRRARKVAASTQISLAVLELEAGALIGLAPHCPPWASRRVDRLTVRRDALLGVEVVL